MFPALYLENANPQPEDLSLPCWHRDFREDTSFSMPAVVSLPSRLQRPIDRQCLWPGTQGTVLCRFRLPTALPRGAGGGRHPQELQITYIEDSTKWNKFPNSHYLTSLRDRRPPLTRYRERAAVSASHSFPGRLPASQARAAPPAPESRA